MVTKVYPCTGEALIVLLYDLTIYFFYMLGQSTSQCFFSPAVELWRLSHQWQLSFPPEVLALA